MRAVPFLLAFSVAGCTFRINGVDRAPPDSGSFRLEGGTTQPPRDLSVAGAPDLTTPATVPPPPADLASPPDLAGGFLDVTSATPGGSVDLSKEGKIDWAHWGAALASDYDHKASGGGQISNYALTGGVVFQYGDSQVSYKWNDGVSGLGQHSNSMGMSTTGVYVSGTNNGFKVTLPADPNARHARIYLGGFKASGQLRASLSDGSGSAFEDHAYGDVNGSFNVVYDVKYAAAGAAQTLLLQWTMYGGDATGNVTLQAATMLP